ncbi:pyruvate dehydrogenase [Dehalococcoidia bacterium]|nr:pyruvate dehydrogenase [Dehalococcoidia bacterium]
MTLDSSSSTSTINHRDEALKQVQNRVLWLSMQLVHHANNVRPNLDDGKVGGHQSSSASVVTILTSLYFDFMRAGDRISLKPHASPVYHAIQYLLGNLDPKYMTMMRGFRGLQAYPSRMKDPDDVDFSNGSVGIGSVAPNFAALVDEYVRDHLSSGDTPDRRYISVVGDAELDEGSVWEAIAEPAMEDLSNVIWIVDLNRQSLDRTIPGIRVQAWREMFGANGWNVIDAKYGKKMQAKFAEPYGDLLRTAIDEMSNELYQRLLRVSTSRLREWLPSTSRYPNDLARFINRWDDDELREVFHNLGGHDFGTMREAFSVASGEVGPHVVFAYTMKGWRLPSIGDPQNHSVTMSGEQMLELASDLGVDQADVWARLPPDSEAGRLCEEVAESLGVGRQPTYDPPEIRVPGDFGQSYQGTMATQQIFGLVLTALSREAPEVAGRIVTVSPDVASSTNLGGWINKVGVWSRTEPESLPDDEVIRALRWEEHRRGQHVELGISENNLFMMLGQLGLSMENSGEILFPIGTLYDPFIIRGLDAFIYGIYSGAKFIVVGTPSGVTLAPEGGAHQSQITPSIGVEMPELDFYEPCFGQELEWIMLAALEQLLVRGRSTYLRLTSKRVDQGLFGLAYDQGADVGGRDRIKQQVLNGAYRLIDRSTAPDYRPGVNVVHILASGAMIPEAIDASEALYDEGVFANVVNVTGPGPLYRRFQRSVSATMSADSVTSRFMADSIPLDARSAPVVTVVDGHPHSLAWIGGALKTVTLPLGVTEFGQSGSRPELYKEYGIDRQSIVAACLGALEV